MFSSSAMRFSSAATRFAAGAGVLGAASFLAASAGVSASASCGEGGAAAGTTVYEVNLEVDAAVAPAFKEWLRPHMAEMLDIEGFLSAEMLAVEAPAAKPKPVVLFVLGGPGAGGTETIDLDGWIDVIIDGALEGRGMGGPRYTSYTPIRPLPGRAAVLPRPGASPE